MGKDFGITGSQVDMVLVIKCWGRESGLAL